MKPKKVIPALVFAALGSVSLVACNKGGNSSEPSKPDISVTAVRQVTDVNILDVETYDYTSLFTITSDGENVTVLSSYVDSSAVVAETGVYGVTCTYEEVGATAYVNVVTTVYSLELSQDAVTVLTSKVAETDFNTFFTAKVDGVAVEITPSMVTSNVVAADGNYTYTVTLGDKTKTLSVKVIDDVTIVATYALKELELSEVKDYDYTELFSLYVEGAAVRVTDAMLDKSAADSAAVGQTFDVTLNYEYKNKNNSLTAKVRVVADRAYSVSSRNIVIYPHGETIDLTTLFTIKHGDEEVEVTPDMVSGTVDYSVVGTNTITLSFNGNEYTAVVDVQYGVIIDYASTDTVMIRKGTSSNTYAFSNDFKLIINGIRFFAIPDTFFEGIDSVDFDTEGEYEVTLKVPYSSSAPTISGGARFDYTELTVKYTVVERIGEVNVINQNLSVAKSAGSYNVFNNLIVTIDGRKQSLTKNPDYVTPITCYAEVLSDAIDFTTSSPQKVRIAVYVYGNDKTPITVEYTVTVRSNVVVTPIDRGVFTGDTVFTRDLFTVTEDGQPVTVTNDMISGKADTFTPGVYQITLEYGGVSATATVTVFDNAMKGTYKTKLTTIPTSSDSADDDSDSEDYWGSSEYYSLSSGGGVNVSADTSAVDESAVLQLDDLVIRDDGRMTYNGYVGEVINGIDETTLVVRFATNEYTLHYYDGIIVLDPHNTLMLSFSEYRRPLIFFNSDIWDIGEFVTVNYGSSYVLSNTTIGYSIDTFHITKKDNSGESLWYALYVRLAEKTSADTVYVVDWGEATYADGFTPAAEVQSSVTFNGETYKFTMTDSKTAVIDKTGMTNGYAGKTFIGTIDGKPSQFVATTGGFELRINGLTAFSFTLGYDFPNSKNAYIDYSSNTVFLYKFSDKDIAPFSYKFVLDTSNNTFTIAEKDKYYGLYYGTDKYIFVDGYGTGLINFDNSNNSSVQTQFRYTVTGSVLYMTYLDTSPTFAYGTGAEFYVGEFLNTLTTKVCLAEQFVGDTLENSIITDGAIVNIGQYEFSGVRGTRSEQTVKSDILDAIRIVTKDGELTAAEKANVVDLKCVSYTTSGYYKITVRLNVGGESVEAVYTIQLIVEDHSTNPLLTAYGIGELGNRYSLVLDSFGRASIVCGEVTYIGYVTPKSDSEAFVKVYNSAGGYITATVERVADGIIKLTAVGTESFTEYFTTGSSRVVGFEGLVIREFTVGAAKTFVVASAANTTGNVVTAEYVSGTGANESVIKIDDGQSTKYYLIKQWGNTTDGIALLADYVE